MPGSFRRWYALAIVVFAAAVASLILWRTHGHSRPLLRAGIRNNSLSASLSPEGRIDALAVEVLTTAARRIGVPLKWVDCPEGPDQALGKNKVDLWPIAMELPERKSQFHITEPWLASARCLVTKGAPPERWAGVSVAYGMGPESQLLAVAEAKLAAGAAGLPENRFTTLTYESLAADPAGATESLYSRLDLGDFTPVRETIAAEAARRREYRARSHPPEGIWRDRINTDWASVFAQYGYNPL
jgi:hypothetical protein